MLYDLTWTFILSMFVSFSLGTALLSDAAPVTS